MKTILVLSDTHGSASAFTRVAAKNPKADALIFLGDGCKDLEKVQDALPMPVYPVHGNCDFGALEPGEGLVAFEGVLFYYVHGHQYNVKYSYEDLARNAICRGADVALFGHTHCPDLVQLDKVTLFNPGSAAIPRSGRPTYGRITVEEGKAPVFEHLEMPDYE